jgi:ketosteroid isomerase-like protein
VPDDLRVVVDQLAARVAALEDRLAIYQLIASYGPAADRADSAAVGAMWTDDGSYDAQVGAWTGPAAIAGMIDGEMHQSLVHAGCAHVLSLPSVEVDGDRALAISHGRLYRRDGDEFRVWRVTATRWELRRVDGHWRVERRVNRVLDGDADARALLQPDRP